MFNNSSSMFDQYAIFVDGIFVKNVLADSDWEAWKKGLSIIWRNSNFRTERVFVQNTETKEIIRY